MSRVESFLTVGLWTARVLFLTIPLLCCAYMSAHICTRTTRIYHFNNIIRKVKFSLFYAWMERNKTINLNYYSMFPNNICYVSCQNFYAIPKTFWNFPAMLMNITHASWLYNEITTQSSFELFWWICLWLIVINSKLNESKSRHVIFNFCLVLFFKNIHIGYRISISMDIHFNSSLMQSNV